MVAKSERLTQGDLLGSTVVVARRTRERKAMPQQKSEHCVVAEAARKRGPTRRVLVGGAKAVPVNERLRSLRRPFGTAEDPKLMGADGRAAWDLTQAALFAEPKPKSERRRACRRRCRAPLRPRIEHSGMADRLYGGLYRERSRARGIVAPRWGYVEVANRPMVGVITHRPEEPYVNSTSTVL